MLIIRGLSQGFPHNLHLNRIKSEKLKLQLAGGLSQGSQPSKARMGEEPYQDQGSLLMFRENVFFAECLAKLIADVH